MCHQILLCECRVNPVQALAKHSKSSWLREGSIPLFISLCSTKKLYSVDMQSQLLTSTHNVSRKRQGNTTHIPFLGWIPNSPRKHFLAMTSEFVGTILFLFFSFAGIQIAQLDGSVPALQGTALGDTNTVGTPSIPLSCFSSRCPLGSLWLLRLGYSFESVEVCSIQWHVRDMTRLRKEVDNSRSELSLHFEEFWLQRRSSWGVLQRQLYVPRCIPDHLPQIRG